MSIAITIDHAIKKYGQNTIIPGLDLHIKEGEFFTLLGPSGCGKTTLLRMIAGFNTIEGGEIRFNDKVINQIEPGKRGIGMVFQNYAIFPNMSVRKNVEFGLKYTNMTKDEADAETDRFLHLVHVDEYADRMPERLSGGQQQRVALARALVIRPDVLLMDEPLSNLDAKLRVEMRTAIRNIQKEVGITTVYVTHDQEEAMAVSDRIAVMKDGVVHHCGDPRNIYQRPADMFVASFIGKSNMLKAKLKVRGGQAYLQIGSHEAPVNTIREEEIRERDVILSVRPEELQLRKNADEQGIMASVNDSVFLGLNTHYFAKLETGEEVEIIQESEIGSAISAGSTVALQLNMEKVNVFDAVTRQSLMTGVKNDIKDAKSGAGEVERSVS